MILFPNAKINLGLNVLRRRPDGYHDLSMVMVPIPWTDVLEIVPSLDPFASDTLTVTGREVNCPPEKNLVMKATRLLREKSKFPAVDIYLRKVIPDGAGLGGGSADASFTLVGLNQLFNLGLSNDELAEIASSIGADCPFFVYNVPMLCTGTGTTLSPIPFQFPKGMWIAVVKPEVSVPTADAYRHVTPNELAECPAEIVLNRPMSEWQSVLKNDFEASVFPSYPRVATVKEKLAEFNPVYVSMSGSGSAVYAIFDNDNFSDALKEAFAGCDIFVSPL